MSGGLPLIKRGLPVVAIPRKVLNVIFSCFEFYPAKQDFSSAIRLNKLATRLNKLAIS